MKMSSQLLAKMHRITSTVHHLSYPHEDNDLSTEQLASAMLDLLNEFDSSEAYNEFSTASGNLCCMNDYPCTIELTRIKEK